MNHKDINNQEDRDPKPNAVVASKKKQKLGLILAASIMIMVIAVAIALITITVVSDDHTVSFDSRGGSEVDNIDMTEDGRLGQLSKPTREGYIFDGWYVSDTEKWKESNTVEEDTELFAKWRVTISFDSNGGGEIATYTVLEGEKIVAPSAPVKDGLVFGAWYNGDTRWDFETHTVDNSISLKATWNYRITFDTQGGTAIGVQGVASGEKIEKPKTTTYKGRIFKGWYLNDEEWDFETDSITESLTLTAKWEVSVTFDSDGGSREETQTFAPGGVAIEPEQEPTKGGYKFKGWYWNDEDWDFATVVESGKKLEAKWVKLHDVLFDVTGLEMSNKIEEGSTLTAPTLAPKDGYIFLGWFYEDGEGLVVEWDFADVVTSDLILTPKWEPKEVVEEVVPEEVVPEEVVPE